MKALPVIIVIAVFLFVVFQPKEVDKNSPLVTVTREENTYHIPAAVWVVVVVLIGGAAKAIYQSQSKLKATRAFYDALKNEPGKAQSAELVRDEFGDDPLVRKNDKTFTMANMDKLHNVDPESTEEYRRNKPK